MKIRSAALLLLSAMLYGPLSSAEMDLREEAMNCNVVAFAPFMTEVTRERVIWFDDRRMEVDSMVQSIYEKGSRIFGSDDVERTKTGVKVRLKEPHDKELIEIFRPMYQRYREEHPEERPFIDFNLNMSWDVECRIVQFYQACLEDAAYCRAVNDAGSAFRMEAVDGQWLLIHNRSQEMFERSVRVGDMILRMARWIDEYLGSYDGETFVEEFELRLIIDHAERMSREIGMLQSGM